MIKSSTTRLEQIVWDGDNNFEIVNQASTKLGL